MTLSDLIGPAVVAAIVSGLVTLLGTSSRCALRVASIRTRLPRKKTSLSASSDSETDLEERKFRYERALHDYRRNVEFAEELLTSIHKLKDVVRSVRGPFSYGDESKSRNCREFENEAEASSRDGFYVPIARLQKNSDFLSDLTSKKYRAQAIFKTDIHRAFERRWKCSTRYRLHLTR